MSLKWLNKIESQIADLSFENEINRIIEDLQLSAEHSETETKTREFLIRKELEYLEESLIFDFLFDLNCSVIEGEFLDEKFIEKLQGLILKIGNSLQYLDLSFLKNQQLEDTISDIIKSLDFLFSFKKCLECYQISSKYIFRLIFNRDKNTLFDLSDESTELIEKLKISNRDLIKSLVVVFFENLYLFRKDFTLVNADGNFEKLLISKHKLETCKKNIQTKNSIRMNAMIDFLIEKSTFFIRKIIIRKNQDENSHNEAYAFLGEDKKFDLSEHSFTTETFKNWDDYSQAHYFSEHNSIFKTKLLQQKPIADKSFFLTHSLIKYEKDLIPNIDNLKKITFNNINTQKLEFNDFSKNVATNYLRNNVLSFLVDIQIQEINENYDVIPFVTKQEAKIKSNQASSIINNFFPYKKLCFLLVTYIDYLLKDINNNPELIENKIEKIEKAVKKIQDIYVIYNSSLKWCKSHLFYAYQLPFEECIIKMQFGNVDINSFTSSSFLLPLNYSVLTNEMVETKNYMDNVKNQISSLKNSYMVFNKQEKYLKQLENQILKQKDELKEQSKKSIELLSVFTAILALIFGGISTASDKSTFEERFLTFISLFVILFAFITLVRTFISKEKNLYEIIGLFFLYIISIILIITLLSITIKFHR